MTISLKILNLLYRMMFRIHTGTKLNSKSCTRCSNGYVRFYERDSFHNRETELSCPLCGGKPEKK